MAQPISEQLQLTANLTLNKHTYENNPNLSSEDIVGNDIVSAPKLLANVAANYNSGDWDFNLRGQYVDEYYLNAENTSSYSGHTLLHGRVNYQYSNALSLAFNVDNLLDRRYAERANYTSFTQERYFPGMPRNVKLSVKYQF